MKSHIKVALVMFILATIVVSQSSCGLAARLKKPIKDFRDATNLVTTSTEAGYVIVNRRVMDRFLKKKQCADLDADETCKTAQTGDDAILMNPADVRKARIFSDKAIQARLEAFQSLNRYVDLLTAIANTDKPEKIARSADELKSSIDALAARIAEMAQAGDAGESDDGNNAVSSNSANFLNVTKLFTEAVSVVLTAIAQRKRDKALKEAVQKGTEPTKQLIAAIKSDLSSFWLSTITELNKDREVTFEAFNEELQAATTTGQRPDTGKLESLRRAVIETLEEQSTLEATNPKNAIEAMERAHTALVDATNQPIEKNFVAALGAVEAYVRTATRLGAAIVKLSEKDNAANGRQE